MNPLEFIRKARSSSRRCGCFGLFCKGTCKIEVEAIMKDTTDKRRITGELRNVVAGNVHIGDYVPYSPEDLREVVIISHSGPESCPLHPNYTESN